MSAAGVPDPIAPSQSKPLRPRHPMAQPSRRLGSQSSAGSPLSGGSSQGLGRPGLGRQVRGGPGLDGPALAGAALVGLARLGQALRSLWTPAPLLAVLLVVGLVQPGAGWAFEKVDYTLTNQSGQDFHGQPLANSSFAGVVGRGANFAGADLSGAILTQAAFPAGDFHGTDLTDALMDRADFSDTDLRGAILRGAIASGSRFGGARIENADFSDALIDRASQRQLCRTASGTNPVSGVATRESLGC